MKANLANTTDDFQPIRVTVTLESQYELDGIKFLAEHVAGSEMAEAYAAFMEDEDFLSEKFDYDTYRNSFDVVEQLCLLITGINPI